MDKEYSITIDGEQVAFKFKDSLIHATGEHAGNIDAIITTNPPLPQNLLLDEFHIKVPGTDEYLYIYGYGVVENSLKATFNSSTLVDTKKLPEMVEVYWGANGEKFIGEMSCQAFSAEAESKIVLDESEPEKVNDELDESKPIKGKGTTSKPSSNYNYLILIIVLIFVLIGAFFFIS